MEDPVALLRTLVAFDTTNNPDEGVRAPHDCWRFVLDRLLDSNIPARMEVHGGYPMVTGALGDRPPRVLLMAHLDVVPPGPRDRWRTAPFELTRRGSRAIGRGAIDDKGNVVAVLGALEALRADGAEGVAFAFPGDEEIGGDHGAAIVADRLPVRYVINGDGQGLRIINRRRNIFRAVVTVPAAAETRRGRPWSKTFTTRTPGREGRHSAYFVPGVDTHAMLAASEYVRREGLAVGRVEGSFVKDNVIPQSVTLGGIQGGGGSTTGEVDMGLSALVGNLGLLVRSNFPTLGSDFGVTILPNVYRRRDSVHLVTLDIRAMAQDSKGLREALVPQVEALVPGARVEVKEGRGCLRTPPESELVATAQAVARDLGLPTVPIEREGASDAQFFSARGIDCIDFGPLGGNVHGPNEYVEVASLGPTTRFYRDLAQALVMDRGGA